MALPLRIWSEIDPDAIQHNARFAKTRAGTGLIAVVKAEAYGHGAAIAIPALREIADVFALSNVGEAAAVREIAAGKPLLLLSPCLPEERRVAVELGCIATVSSAAEAAAFGTSARVSLKVDTGMGRIGVWRDEALGEISEIVASGVTLHSIATHLPSADEDAAFTKTQLEGFAEFAAKARTFAPGVMFHALNSAGLCAHPDFRFDFVRAGLVLYGSASLPEYQPFLKPALTWKTRVILVRDVPAGRGVSYGRTFTTARPTRIATLAAGYADGYPRQASNRGACVLVGGRRCPILGRVTMDQILVDVTEAGAVNVGAEAVLIGSQGGKTVLAGELAEWGGTIAWDIFTSIGGRTQRTVSAACADSD